MFSSLGLRRVSVLAGVFVLIGVAQTASGSSLRARQSQQQQAASGAQEPVSVSVRGRYSQPHQRRSLKSTRDPQCNLPEAFPCTLNTTAIGMVENGFATYYDDTCEANGFEGCFTDDIPACRTCYLSTEVYMAATNATENSRPKWTMCPCCVPTTLEDEHFDVEVIAFDYAVFNISEDACTDPPTPAPDLAQSDRTASPPPATPAPPTPSPSAAPETPEPTVAATTAATEGATPVPEASRDLGPPAPTAGTPDVDENGAEAGTVDTSGGDDGLSMGAKIGIGAGAAVGVIILGAAGYGVMKSRGGGGGA